MQISSSMKTNFKDYLKSKAFTAKSIQSRMVVFNQYLKWIERENPSAGRAGLEIGQVSYNDLLLFMKHCQHKGVSQRTIQHYMIVVRHFYDYLVREGITTTNPATDIVVRGAKRKALYHILEPHDLQALYNQYPVATIKDRRNKVILGLLVYQGLRTEELARLEVKDIKLREGKIDVLGGRKSNGRLLELAPGQVMDMYDYVLQIRNEIAAMKPKRKAQTRKETDKLFIGEGGNCYSFSNMMTQLMIKVRKISRSLSGPTVQNAKQVRASVITKWLKAYNLREAQYLAGHRYISSTESYLQNDMEGLKEEVQQYHPLG